jgi:tetratricopeptide (TPR) repeat protein
LSAAAAWHFGLPAYRQFKERRALRLAQAFIRTGAFENARLSARQTLALNPTNVEACRLMAHLVERSRAPQAIAWRKRVAELSPSISNQLDLAACALLFEAPPFPTTSAILDRICPSASNQVSFHLISAERALRLHQLPEAEREFSEAVRLEPTNQLHCFNSAILRLQSPDVPVANEARSRLTALVNDPLLGASALRSLVADAFIRQDWQGAIKLSKRLLAETNAAFADYMEHLSILQAAHHPDFKAHLASLERAAATNLSNATDLGSWLNHRNLAGETLAWAQTLGPTLESMHPIRLLTAEAYMRQENWTGLQKWLRNQKWDDQDFERFALLARAWQADGATTAAQVDWHRSVRLASERPERLAALATLAQEWGWTNELEALLWHAAREHSRERWAAGALERILHREGNTRALLELYTIRLQHNATDLVAMNNLATVCLLLKTNLAQAYKWADELYRQNPTNASAVSTYALSLYVRGRVSEAVGAMSRLDAAELQRPGTAVYYVGLLTAAGDCEKAEVYRAAAERSSLLPEEREWLRIARNQRRE